MRKYIIERMKEGWRDNTGQMMIIGAILFLAVMVGGIIFAITIVMNLETIGKGILYIALAIGTIIGVSAIAKRYTSTEGREIRRGVR